MSASEGVVVGPSVVSLVVVKFWDPSEGVVVGPSVVSLVVVKFWDPSEGVVVGPSVVSLVWEPVVWFVSGVRVDCIVYVPEGCVIVAVCVDDSFNCAS